MVLNMIVNTRHTIVRKKLNPQFDEMLEKAIQIEKDICEWVEVNMSETKHQSSISRKNAMVKASNELGYEVVNPYTKKGYIVPENCVRFQLDSDPNYDLFVKIK